MKNRAIRSILAMCLAAALVLPTESVIYGAKASGEDAVATEENSEEVFGDVIEIGSVEDFMKFVENCSSDSWSVDKTISLTTDLDLCSVDFGGIGYFDGTFEGNGHQISNVSLDKKGSNYGFFRYIGELGTVNQLIVAGSIAASGSGENIGGIVGTNYGTVKNCSFVGSVTGQNRVGGIAGSNKATGSIVHGTSNAVVLATNDTGGIAGKNEGMISGCTNSSSVNVEELETSLNLGAVDIGSLNLTKRVVNRNNMGGIAGSSAGVISDCTNAGIIGFNHTGYNVGGIAGSQSGTVLNCKNTGTIYGRKDVGGIVGQAEPYIESEYLEDKVAETKEDINRLNRTLRGISNSIDKASAETRNYVDSMTNQYSASMDNISGSLNELSNAVSKEHPEAQGYVDNIKNSLNNIQDIQSQEGSLTQEQLDEIEGNLGVINDNLESLQGSYAGTGDSAEALVESISNELQNSGQDKNLQGIVESVDRGVQSVADGINSAANQMNNITNNISEDLTIITSGEEFIQDISSVETAENVDGVVSECINYGKIYGDLNTGGIAGTMNVEYEGDPEFDLDLTGSINITLRSTVNNVIIHSINYGTVEAKKNCAGGITGLQELGLIYDCEGYGSIESESGNYLGGIAGQSAAAIQKTYSLCNVSGEDYVGGICGKGYTVTESISISSIEGEGECLGSVAGQLKEEGTVRDNFFVSEEFHGVDDISYAGIAEKKAYDEIMAMEGIPESFHQVTVTFETEDGEILGEKTIAYGSSLAEGDFPQAHGKEGFYVSWENAEKLEDIRSNLTVTAEYVPWTESIAGNAVSEDGKDLFLVEGEFREDTELIMKETEKPAGLAENETVEYAYSWEISGKEQKESDTLEGHFYIPVEEKDTALWIKQDGNWREVDTLRDGSYLTAELPYGAEFALISVPASNTVYVYIVAAGGAAFVLLVVLLVRRMKKRRKK